MIFSDSIYAAVFLDFSLPHYYNSIRILYYGLFWVNMQDRPHSDPLQTESERTVLFFPRVSGKECSTMAKQTMAAIRKAELDAEQALRTAQVQANESVADTQARAEQMIADANRRAAEKLAETRSQAEQESKTSALAAADDVTREIEALRAQGRRNEAKAIESVIAEMS